MCVRVGTCGACLLIISRSRILRVSRNQRPKRIATQGPVHRGGTGVCMERWTSVTTICTSSLTHRAPVPGLRRPHLNDAKVLKYFQFEHPKRRHDELSLPVHSTAVALPYPVAYTPCDLYSTRVCLRRIDRYYSTPLRTRSCD